MNIEKYEKTFLEFSVKNVELNTENECRILKLDLECKSGKTFNFSKADRLMFDNTVYHVQMNNFEYKIEIAFFRNHRILAENIYCIELYVDKISRTDIKDISREMTFKVFNIGRRIFNSDYESEHANRKTKSLSKFCFSLQGINWYLIDEAFFNDERDPDKPLLNGRLVASNAESYVIAKKQMRYICQIISFATEKDVQCFEALDSDGILIETFNDSAYKYGKDGHVLIDMFCDEGLESLLTKAYVPFINDKDWWSITFSYWQEILFANGIESKMILTAVLLDRIADKFLKKNLNLLDSCFDEKKEVLFKELDVVLSHNLDKWSKTRLEALKGILYNWNNEESDIKQIASLSDDLNIPKLGKNCVSTRGQLIHTGTFPRSHKNTTTSFEVLLETMVFILFVLFRKMDYTGEFKHYYFSGEKKSMKNIDRSQNVKEFQEIRLREVSI
jgi:hypothetical protein